MMATTKDTPTLGDDMTPATARPQTVDVLDSEVFQRFLAAADDATQEVDEEAITVEIIGRILNATSVDDVLGGRDATHARDFLGVPFALTGVRFNRSDFEGTGPAFYALLEGADADGQKVTVTCGARNVIAQAWKLADMGALPVRVQLREADRPTRNGYRVMWLEASTEPF